MHELARSYGVNICDDLDIPIQRICEASKRSIPKDTEDQDETRRPKRLKNAEEESVESSSANHNPVLQGQDLQKIIIEQNTGRNPSNIEFDGMEHDLIDEGDANAKE